MPGWKQRVGLVIDQTVSRVVPDVRKAVKWNTPLYGLDGESWFLAYHCFDRYVKVTFFRGTSLDPMPPGTSKQAEVRYLDIREDDPIDGDQLERWISQASRLPGARL